MSVRRRRQLSSSPWNVNDDNVDPPTPWAPQTDRWRIAPSEWVESFLRRNRRRRWGGRTDEAEGVASSAVEEMEEEDDDDDEAEEEAEEDGSGRGGEYYDGDGDSGYYAGGTSSAYVRGSQYGVEEGGLRHPILFHYLSFLGAALILWVLYLLLPRGRKHRCCGTRARRYRRSRRGRKIDTTKGSINDDGGRTVIGDVYDSKQREARREEEESLLSTSMSVKSNAGGGDGGSSGDGAAQYHAWRGAPSLLRQRGGAAGNGKGGRTSTDLNITDVTTSELTTPKRSNRPPRGSRRRSRPSPPSGGGGRSAAAASSSSSAAARGGGLYFGGLKRAALTVGGDEEDEVEDGSDEEDDEEERAIRRGGVMPWTTPPPKTLPPPTPERRRDGDDGDIVSRTREEEGRARGAGEDVENFLVAREAHGGDGTSTIRGSDDDSGFNVVAESASVMEPATDAAAADVSFSLSAVTLPPTIVRRSPSTPLRTPLRTTTSSPSPSPSPSRYGPLLLPSPRHPDPNSSHVAPAYVLVEATLHKLESECGVVLLAHGSRCVPKNVWIRLVRRRRGGREGKDGGGEVEDGEEVEDTDEQSGTFLTWQTETLPSADYGPFAATTTSTPSARAAPSSSSASSSSRGPLHSLPLTSILYVDVGRKTDALRLLPPDVYPDALCLSLLTTGGSLDLSAKTVVERDALVSAFCVLLDEASRGRGGGSGWRELGKDASSMVGSSAVTSGGGSGSAVTGTSAGTGTASSGGGGGGVVEGGSSGIEGFECGGSGIGGFQGGSGFEGGSGSGSNSRTGEVSPPPLSRPGRIEATTATTTSEEPSSPPLPPSSFLGQVRVFVTTEGDVAGGGGGGGGGGGSGGNDNGGSGSGIGVAVYEGEWPPSSLTMTVTTGDPPSLSLTGEPPTLSPRGLSPSSLSSSPGRRTNGDG